MDVADIIIEDFLYQNAFSKYDYFCPLPKSVRTIIRIIVIIIIIIIIFSEANSNKLVSWKEICAVLSCPRSNSFSSSFSLFLFSSLDWHVEVHHHPVR